MSEGMESAVVTLIFAIAQLVGAYALYLKAMAHANEAKKIGREAKETAQQAKEGTEALYHEEGESKVLETLEKYNLVEKVPPVKRVEEEKPVQQVGRKGGSVSQFTAIDRADSVYRWVR